MRGCCWQRRRGYLGRYEQCTTVFYLAVVVWVGVFSCVVGRLDKHQLNRARTLRSRIGTIAITANQAMTPSRCSGRAASNELRADRRRNVTAHQGRLGSQVSMPCGNSCIPRRVRLMLQGFENFKSVVGTQAFNVFSNNYTWHFEQRITCISHACLEHVIAATTTQAYIQLCTTLRLTTLCRTAWNANRPRSMTSTTCGSSRLPLRRSTAAGPAA